MKTRYPRAVAIKVAADLCRELKQACEPDRLIVAGSLRRRKPDVGDIELVYIPTFATVPDGLFETKKVSRADEVMDAWLRSGVITKRESVRGTTAWGAKNKLAMHTATGIPVDFFATTAGSWWNYLVCRTGGADNNKAIAMAAQRKGWTWTPYGEGFLDERNQMVPVRSERDAFELVGLRYAEPWAR